MPSELLSPVAIRALVELTLSYGNARTVADVQTGQREIPQEGACRCLIVCVDPEHQLSHVQHMALVPSSIALSIDFVQYCTTIRMLPPLMQTGTSMYTSHSCRVYI